MERVGGNGDMLIREQGGTPRAGSGVAERWGKRSALWSIYCREGARVSLRPLSQQRLVPVMAGDSCRCKLTGDAAGLSEQLWHLAELPPLEYAAHFSRIEGAPFSRPEERGLRPSSARHHDRGLAKNGYVRTHARDASSGYRR